VFTERAMSRELGRKLEELVALRMNREPPEVELSRWIEGLPGSVTV